MADELIESILNESRSFPPSKEFSDQANINEAKAEEMRKLAADDHIKYWAKLANEELHWSRPFSNTLDDSKAPNYEWFNDGEINASYNSLDVNVSKNPHKTAIIFEKEDGKSESITYKELLLKTSQFANGLKKIGVEPMDRVVIYMPMCPEAVIAMQACARIGAIHSVVFGGFSSNALKDRIEDAQSKIVITADGAFRGGGVIPLKQATDEAVSQSSFKVNNVVVFKRTGENVNFNKGTDIWWEDLVADCDLVCEPKPLNAEHPLFILYTSGSTGKPKGIQHATAGYILHAKTTFSWIFDIKNDDVFWCTADVGWITGHTYVAYGPLLSGATILIYEGAPTYPDVGRFWSICEKHSVTIFYTAPTAIRALMKHGDEIPANYDLSKLRLLGTVGEPINPEAWIWYHKVIGGEHCPIVDTWWQTETGGAMISPLPGITNTKPGSCTTAIPGIDIDIVNESGEPVDEPNQGGYLVIKKPWPSMLRTIWGDNQRYIDTYWEKFDGKYYVAGDSAYRDEDDCHWIMGRIDDVLNVSGHRLGTMEVESALVANEKVAEAAVVGRPHEVKGESIFAFVVTKGNRPTGNDAKTTQEELREWVASQVGSIAKPDEIRFSDNLPKTRSGKIMRRLLRAIARQEEITQDISTLEDESIVKQLQGEE
ncbi:MAG: acetate--CoA ligase [Gammaproteobacteria bacterium]|nr:acetate--CoA ligase [Gammaproteobacteria bacterium]MDC3239696.1 acetate--CoA ligase [Gammaproteobacteria bacterium]RZO96204.1 MAG: acetate--CoA ligase [Gammaproteobacteria bacterium]